MANNNDASASRAGKNLFSGVGRAEIQRYMAILDALPFPVRIADANTNWVCVNAASEKLFGLKRGEMLGKPCDHNKFCICGTDNCSLARAARGFSETFFKHGNSSYRVEVAVIRSAGGDISGFIEMIHDVTESANQEENLKSILNGMEALVTVCTPEEGRVLFLNDSIRKHFGIESDGVGRLCYEVLQGRDTPCPSCPAQQLIGEPDKTIVWDHKECVKGAVLRKTAKLIDWPGGEKAHLEYAVDITAITEAEEALKHREKMQKALNSAALVLMAKSTDAFANTMSEGVRIIADIVGVDRMSISRNVQKPDGLYASQVFRWSRRAGSSIPTIEELKENSYDRHISRWKDVLSSGECAGSRLVGAVRLRDCTCGTRM